jgi:PPM family protein phosphatase
MTAPQAVCPRCSATGRAGDRFCETCGASMSAIRRVAVPRPIPARSAGEQPCSDCGNKTHVDGFCTVCGHRQAEPDRDEVLLGGIALVTDRGLEHARNEDAAAAGIVDGGRATANPLAVAVCDGVSSSADSHRAAVAASAAGVDAMLCALGASRTARSAMLAGLAAAARAAAAACTGTARPSAPPSCTYVAAAVLPAAATGDVDISVGSVGDSRVYWLPEPPGRAQLLTVDDSLAQELVAAGHPADSDAVRAGAHTITRWLGADAGLTPWMESSVHTVTAAGPGSLVICTDGLWNYLPDAADIARICAGRDATASARALVEYALSAGGQDNITVAVVPIGGSP